MEWTFLISLLIAVVSFVPVNSELRPAILWDPYNPLFACEDPIIYAKLNNKIPFLCPDKDLTANPQPSANLIYESAYLLSNDQEEDFLKCNATDHLAELLQCDGNYQNKPLILKSHRNYQEDRIFEAGKTYYAIGPTFRKKENASQLIGGSCSQTENSMQYKLRLKIHVCTDEEEKNGTCRLCHTEGCYYSNCDRNCSEWSHISKTQSGLTMSVLQKRICFNKFLQKTEEEYLKKDETICSPPINPKDCGKNCTEWIDMTLVKKDFNCTLIQKRSCENLILAQSAEEVREITTSCPQDPPTAAASSPSSNGESNTYKYLSITLAIACLLLGFFVGAFWHKKYHEKSCLHSGSSNIAPEDGIQYFEKGKDNPVYSVAE